MRKTRRDDSGLKGNFQLKFLKSIGVLTSFWLVLAIVLDDITKGGIVALVRTIRFTLGFGNVRPDGVIFPRHVTSRMCYGPP